ncbi:MAG: alpha/beta fold hydrolase [Acetobacteraceae bacterium]
MTPCRIRTQVLEIAYLEAGPADGPPAILLHGYPDDPLAYAAVAPILAARGFRVLMPWLRGYGETRFLDAATPRSGQQAALGVDLRDFMDALGIPRAILGGYDWGGRAACVVAALWPERVTGLVSAMGYNIQNIAAAGRPAPPEQEVRYWYQWYFQTERGRAGLETHRAALARMLWRMWSPDWAFPEAEFAATAPSFDNPDHVAVVIQSYRHRYAAVVGDPAYAGLESRLAGQPPIAVPTVVLHGASDGVTPAADPATEAARFPALRRRTVLERVGHFVPREAPEVFAAAVAELRA